MIYHTSIGMRYFFRGFSLLGRRGLRRFVFIPLVINILLFKALFWLASHFFQQFTLWIDSFLPSWLQWLDWLLWAIFAVAFYLFFIFTFITLANVVGAPFNSILAENVEKMMNKPLPDNNQNTPWSDLLKEVPRTLKRESQKLCYYIPRALGILTLFFIPIVHIFAAFAWFAFNAWMMAVEYLDYPMENHHIDFPTAKNRLRERRSLSFGFGASVALISLIPFVNFFVMPAAVVGGTLLWLNEFEE